MKKHFSLMMALLTVSAMLFSCKKDEGPQKVEYKPSFTKAEQASYTPGAEYATYTLKFEGEGTALEMNFSAALEEIPMAAGEYTIVEELSAAKQAVVTSYKNSESSAAVKAQSGKVTVAVSGSEYTFDFDFIMSNSATLKGSFKGSVTNMQQPEPEPGDYNVTFTSAKQTSYTAAVDPDEEGNGGVPYAVYGIEFADAESTMTATFANSLVPMGEGEYTIAAEIAQENDATVSYKNAEGETVTAKSGKVTVAFDIETRAYTYTFALTMSDDRSLTGKYEGEVKDIQIPEVKKYAPKLSSAQQTSFTMGKDGANNVYVIEFTYGSNKFDLTLEDKNIPVDGEYAIGGEGERFCSELNYGGFTAKSGTATFTFDKENNSYKVEFKDVVLVDDRKFDRGTLNTEYEGEIRYMQMPLPEDAPEVVFTAAKMDYPRSDDANKGTSQFNVVFTNDEGSQVTLIFVTEAYAFPMPAGEYAFISEYWSGKAGNFSCNAYKHGDLDTWEAKNGYAKVALDGRKYTIEAIVVADDTHSMTLKYEGEIADMEYEKPSKDAIAWTTGLYSSRDKSNEEFDIHKINLSNNITYKNGAILEITTPKGEVLSEGTYEVIEAGKQNEPTAFTKAFQAVITNYSPEGNGSCNANAGGEITIAKGEDLGTKTVYTITATNITTPLADFKEGKFESYITNVPQPAVKKEYTFKDGNVTAYYGGSNAELSFNMSCNINGDEYESPFSSVQFTAEIDSDGVLKAGKTHNIKASGSVYFNEENPSRNTSITGGTLEVISVNEDTRTYEIKAIVTDSDGSEFTLNYNGFIGDLKLTPAGYLRFGKASVEFVKDRDDEWQVAYYLVTITFTEPGEGCPFDSFQLQLINSHNQCNAGEYIGLDTYYPSTSSQLWYGDFSVNNTFAMKGSEKLVFEYPDYENRPTIGYDYEAGCYTITGEPLANGERYVFDINVEIEGAGAPPQL